jgi:vacuolar iron transporter family protein
VLSNLLAKLNLMQNNSPNHFKGKDAIGHVVDARVKGRIATSESHGLEVPGHIGELLNSIKETSALLLLLWVSMQAMKIPDLQILYLYTFFFFGWIIWTTGKCAFLGWWRLKRLNRLISEEKWEIEHHRDQEKQELEALYKAKGFSGKLLQDATEVLMADDNRLLQVMLEEEMGLTLSSFEHPLKHALFAAIGVFSTFLVICGSIFYIPTYGIYISASFMIGLSIIVAAKKEKADLMSSTIWLLGIVGLAFAFSYYISQIIKTYFL